MGQNIIQVQRWSRARPPTEMELAQQLGREGLEPRRWSAEPGAVFHAQTLAQARTIFVVQGMITFGFPVEDLPTTLHPGDRLDLPANVPHNAAVGFDGVVCLEAQTT